MHGHWVLGANDPEFMGWATTVAYLIVAGLSYACGRDPRGAYDGGGRARRFWYVTALLMFCLGLNKELDLQTPFLTTARWAARTEGWYGYRQGVRWLFLAAVALSGVALTVRLVRQGPIPLRVYGPACCGLFLLLIYVVIRASPAEHINRVAGQDVSRIHGKRHMLELAGIGCVGIGAATTVLRRRRRRVRNVVKPSGTHE